MSKPKSGYFSGTKGGNSSSPFIQKSVPSNKRKTVSKKTNVSKRITVSKKAMEHSTLGEYILPTGSKGAYPDPRLKGGGHSQECIKYMDKKGIEYEITKEYKNGVRAGNVHSHKEKISKQGTINHGFLKIGLARLFAMQQNMFAV